MHRRREVPAYMSSDVMSCYLACLSLHASEHTFEARAQIGHSVPTAVVRMM